SHFQVAPLGPVLCPRNPSGNEIPFTVSTLTNRLPRPALPGHWFGAAAGSAPALAGSPGLPSKTPGSPQLQPFSAILENKAGRQALPRFVSRSRETTSAARRSNQSAAGDTPPRWKPTVPLPIFPEAGDRYPRNAPAANARRAFFQSRSWCGRGAPSTFRADDIGLTNYSVHPRRPG